MDGKIRLLDRREIQPCEASRRVNSASTDPLGECVNTPNDSAFETNAARLARMPSRRRVVRQVEDMMATIGTRRSADLVLGAIALGLLLGSGAVAPREALATAKCPSNGD